MNWLRRLWCGIVGHDMRHREFEYERPADAPPATLSVCDRCHSRAITILPREWS